jgi:hypothetical protein
MDLGEEIAHIHPEPVCKKFAHSVLQDIFNKQPSN